MKRTMMTLLAVAGVLVMGAMGPAAVIPVTSYSFEETPALDDGGFLEDSISPGWTRAGKTYIMNPLNEDFDGTSGSPGTLPGTGDGLHFAILSQIVAPLIYQNPGSHTILANQTYTLTTAVGKRLNVTYPTEFNIELRAGSDTGAILASTTLTPADVLDGNFVDVAISFDSADFAAQVGQPLYIVYSSPFSGNHYHGVLDNVRLTATAIPEPATMGLLVAGGIATLLRRRRRA